ncbi:ribosomal protein S18-alanine N-acetyltransferase [Granulicella sp. L46]|uniref:ribosomal protein S18-alanine N-acetyltransferase n=1 Tax=Granulicella sp. L46 TaxID=1641865 RepID=UPI00131D6298|nr:ribosomal protein S18-alanine N-acetyltransferase [Granulicella sp. L46]
MSADWLIRCASPADLDAILAIEQACAEAPHWTHPLWLAALSGEQGSEPQRASFVAESNGGIVGFAVASRTGELAELESVAVSPSVRRKGIGKALCQQVMDWSRNGASELELEVRASSDGALALYRSLGFLEQSRRREYYRNPTEDAVLMAARL